MKKLEEEGRRKGKAKRRASESEGRGERDER